MRLHLRDQKLSVPHLLFFWLESHESVGNWHILHQVWQLAKPLDKFKLIWNMYNLQLDLNNKKIKVGERDSVL